MDLKNVKLVVSDMDGTLLNADHNVSDLFFRQFQILKENNIRFVAASGRQYHSILHKLKSIKEDVLIVAENGAYVVENGKEIHVNAFDPKDALHFLSIAQQIPNVYIVLAGKQRAYFLNTSKELETLVSEYYSEYQLLENFDSLPDDAILKLAIYHPEGSEKNVYPHLKHLEGDWQIKVSGEFWLDIALKTSHKGNALLSIQQQMGISSDETMAFGDYLNDVEMLKNATFSYAMDNAHEEVKRVANFKTTSNEEQGVESVLKKLIEVI